MKRLALAILLTMIAFGAQAGTIYDLEVGGVYAEGDYVEVICGVVTASATYGCAVAEAPFGVGNSTWVYLGSGHIAQVGDIVNVYGVYAEYYDLTEIDVGHYTGADPAAYFNVVGTCVEMPAPIYVTAAEIMAAPEHYESCIVWITDGFIVDALPSSYGEWTAQSHEDGTSINFDDYWYDESVLDAGVCADWAIGMWTYSYSAFKLEPFADGFPVVNCVVDSQSETWGGVKSLYR